MFQEGKFYKVPINSAFSRRVVSALCVKVMKVKIVFKHIHRSADDTLSLEEITFRLRKDGSECCSSGNYFASCKDTDISVKPNYWEQAERGEKLSVEACSQWFQVQYSHQHRWHDVANKSRTIGDARDVRNSPDYAGVRTRILKVEVVE